MTLPTRRINPIQETHLSIAIYLDLLSETKPHVGPRDLPLKQESPPESFRVDLLKKGSNHDCLGYNRKRPSKCDVGTDTVPEIYTHKPPQRSFSAEVKREQGCSEETRMPENND